MNRTIKFRVWKPEEKRWVNFPDRGLNSFEPIIDPVYTDNNYFIVQQFTGLKDKNGREIYEGDILKVTPVQEDQYEMEEGRDYHLQVSHDYGGTWICGELCVSTALDDDCFNTEVVGNIFDNPELINHE